MSGGLRTPQWSPDGTRIAALAPGAVVILDAATGAEQARLELPGVRPPVAWEPTGERLAVVGDEGLMVLGPGPASALVLQGAVSLARQPWEPAGGALYAARADDVERVEVDGSSRVVATLDDEGLAARVPTMSTVDGRLAFLATRVASTGEDSLTQNEADDGVGTGLWLREADGTVRLVVSLYAEERDLAWSPQGATLAYVTRHDDSGCHCDFWEGWTVDVETGQAESLVRLVDGAGENVYSESGVRELVGPVPSFAPLARRLAGPTRVETGIAVSRATFPSATTAVLARADAYPDALAAAPMAAAAGAPVLLTPGADLAPAVEDELRRLGVEHAVLLGSADALSERVGERVRALGITVERLDGADRFETAALSARKLGPSVTAVLVEGANADPARGWPDAVAAAPLAAQEAWPILLTYRDELPSASKETLEELGIDEVVLVGGRSAVSGAVEEMVRDAGYRVRRLSGEDRVGTALAVAEELAGDGSLRVIGLATPDNWPDSLTLGPALAAMGGGALLYGGSSLPAPVAGFLGDLDEPVPLLVGGGPDVVAPATVTAALAALRR